MPAEFPNLHHSINQLPALLGSMLEVERAIKIIVEGCVKSDNSRAEFNTTLTEQLNYRLPLGWVMLGVPKFGTRGTTGNPVLYVAIGMNLMGSDAPSNRLRIELTQHPTILEWSATPPVQEDRKIEPPHVIPSHMTSDNRY